MIDRKLFIHKQYLPSYYLFRPQENVCIYTVLSVNTKAKDCAAYRAVGPDISMKNTAYQDGFYELVRGGGDKISGENAHALFPEILEMGWKYRK